MNKISQYGGRSGSNQKKPNSRRNPKKSDKRTRSSKGIEKRQWTGMRG